MTDQEREELSSALSSEEENYSDKDKQEDQTDIHSLDPELEYDNQESALLPPEKKIWEHVNKVQVPTIDLSQPPIDPVKVLLFLNDIGKYHYDNRAAQGLILQKALLGKMERGWMVEADYNLDRLIKRILKWIRNTDEWAKLEYEVKTGRTFSSDKEEHIRRFKLVAKYLGYRAEDDVTKDRFIRSLKPFNIPLQPLKDNGKYKKFSVIEALAKATPSLTANVTNSGTGDDRRLAAAVTTTERTTADNQQDEYPEEDQEVDTLAVITGKKGFVRPRDVGGNNRETTKPPANKIARNSGKHQCPLCGYMHFPATGPLKTPVTSRPMTGFPCFMCGEIGHYMKDCPLRGAITEKTLGRRE